MAIEIRVRPFEAPVRPGWRRRPARTAGQRLIAIGDIHGRWDLLDALLKGVERHLDDQPPMPNRLILLGDFVDRGPDSARVLRFLRSIQQRSASVVVLLGNHEQAMLQSIQGDADAQRVWLEHGATATLSSLGVEQRQTGENAYSFGARVASALGTGMIWWLRNLPHSHRVGDYFFCHAGIRPGRKLDRQAQEDLLWIRRAFLDDTRFHGAIIVHGHSVVDDVDIRHNRVNVDTGAYRSGLLSAVLLSEQGNWVVSASQPQPAEGVAEVDGASHAASAASLTSDP